MKAFLSHSSRDKEFVRAVAQELGRQYCVFDEQSFETGSEFKLSIEKGLDESDVFVLFASKEALKSVWVNLEISEAWYRKLERNIAKSLVYIIDSSIDFSDIPEWLRRGRTEQHNVPKVIARDIRYNLEALISERQHPTFVGRSGDLDRLESFLTPIGSPPPHTVFITGLPGIGRRSLIRKKVPDILKLNKQVEIRIKDGDSINDVCVRVADYVEPYSTQEGFEQIVNEIQKLSFEDSRDRLVVNLRKIVRAQELPVFVDDGGLLDRDGSIQLPIRSIIGSLAPNDEAYIFFVSSRKPYFNAEVSSPVLQLQKLGSEETKRLLALLANIAELQMSPAQISELSEYVAGYPPAAHFAIYQAKQYGVELVIQDKSRLTEFLTTAFLRHLAKSNLSEVEKELLQLLATYSPLPLPVIADVLRLDAKVLSTVLINLVDLALIVTTESNYYRIADPIADAAINAFGFPGNEKHNLVAEKIAAYVTEYEVQGPRSELTGILYRAARLSKNEELMNRSIYLASDVISVTANFYHNGRYSEAIESGYQSLAIRPDNVSARNFLIRALIQEEKWSDAVEQIQELRRYAPLQDISFLEGFLERKRGNVKDAINAYKDAESRGRRDIPLYRELALCYFLIGDLDEASKYINEALAKRSDNRYVVDLWAQISAKRGDESTARRALARLEAVGDPLFYYHRLSMVEWALGNIEKSKDAALKAVQQDDKLPFHVLAHLAYCEIQLGNLQDAPEYLSRLDKEFRNVKKDFRIGLWCRLEIAKGHFGNALLQSERISDKNTAFYKAIRRDALSGELRKTALRDKDRIAYKNELEDLENNLSGIDGDRLNPFAVDTID